MAMPEYCSSTWRELRRSSITVRKRNIKVHTKKKRHKYVVAQRYGGDFPRHMRQDRDRRDFDSLLEQSNRDTARLSAQPDTDVQVISSPTFFNPA
jgi:hypothetical protein